MYKINGIIYEHWRISSELHVNDDEWVGQDEAS